MICCLGLTSNLQPPWPKTTAYGNDVIMSGVEPEFAACKSIASDFLSRTQSTTQATVYAHSDEWGYVLRIYYSSGDTASEGTLVCWSRSSNELPSVAVDLPGRLADLGTL